MACYITVCQSGAAGCDGCFICLYFNLGIRDYLIFNIVLCLRCVFAAFRFVLPLHKLSSHHLKSSCVCVCVHDSDI